MERRGRYPLEVRERAVRLVFEQQAAHGSQWATIESIAGKMGCTSETLRTWVRQAEHLLGQKRLARGRVARDEAVYSLCLEPPPPGPDDAASDAESAARRVKSSFSGELEDSKTLFDSEAVPGGNSRGLNHRLLLSASPGQFSTRHFTRFLTEPPSREWNLNNGRRFRFLPGR